LTAYLVTLTAYTEHNQRVSNLFKHKAQQTSLATYNANCYKMKSREQNIICRTLKATQG